MPATILPFERRDPSSAAALHSDALEPNSLTLHAPHPFVVPPARLTSRNIAHRWAMLSHLTRRYPRRAPDPIR